MAFKLRKAFCILCLLYSFVTLYGDDRFPRPEFKSDYILPSADTPLPRATFFDYADAGVLLIALLAASWLVLKKRSRKGILLLSLFSLLYFGFWRKGCVCSAGSLQNICLALFQTGYAIPVSVLLFFSLPLIFTLFTGRTFCAAVCPLGAIQEIVAVKPLQLPVWLNRGLSILPVLYLTLAVLFAATGADFIICRFDPFVGFFRFGAWPEKFVYGLVILAIGVFIARPYCRFLCPYGVLLGWLNIFARRHTTISPDKCIQCRLCESSCPVGAIIPPAPPADTREKRKGIRRLTILILLTPLLAAGGGFLLSSLSPLLSQVHITVSTYNQVMRENTGIETDTTLESETFRTSGKTLELLEAEANQIRAAFRIRGWILGCLLGIVIAIKFINFSTWRRQEDFLPERISCVSCGRCFDSCPVEQSRLKQLVERKRN